MVIPSASSTVINPIAQPLNVADESRVANTTRNPTPDNVLVRSPEATDNTAERNNTQATTQPRDEFEQSDKAQFQINAQSEERQEIRSEQSASNNDAFTNASATFNARGQASAEQLIGSNLDVVA